MPKNTNTQDTSKTATLTRLARAVAHRFRFVGPDHDDLVQEAYRIGLTAWDQCAGNPSYLFVAMKRELGNYASKSISCLTIKESFEKAAEYRFTVDIGDNQIADGAPNPEERALYAERLLDAAQWLHDFNNVFRRLLADVGVPEKLRTYARSRLLDKGGQGTSQQAARELGVPVRALYRVQARVMARARRSPELRGLHERLHADLGGQLTA